MSRGRNRGALVGAVEVTVPRGRGCEGRAPRSRSPSSATSAGCTLDVPDFLQQEWLAKPVPLPHSETDLPGGGGPERDARVHPRQPPARLPGLRQGRRVTLQDLTFRYGPGNTRMQFPKAPSRSRSRSRRRSRSTKGAASLLPLHPLLVGRGGGRGARGDGPGLRFCDRDLRRRAVPRPLHRQRDRPLPRRRDSPPRSTASRGDLGDPELATVCGLCPVGCNITVTTREGRVSDPSRNIPRSTWPGSRQGSFAHPPYLGRG